MKKYELTNECITFTGRKLYRIKALVDFGDVNAGDLGGFVEKEDNLSHDGNAWVSGDACVYDNARVYDNACVCGNAWVYGNACVCGDACVYGDAWVSGNACVYGDADYLTIGPIGSRDDTVTFARDKDNKIIVKCGCFTGDIDAFIAEVKETHGDNKHAKAYLLAAEMAKVRIKLDREA